MKDHMKSASLSPFCVTEVGKGVNRFGCKCNTLVSTFSASEYSKSFMVSPSVNGLYESNHSKSGGLTAYIGDSEHA